MSTPAITRSRVFLDIQIGTEPAGRLVIELFSDKTPKTCENFRALCTSSYTPPSTSKPLTYKLSPFHRIIDDFMIQGGDITAGDGTGGQSIYGGEFPDENIGWRSIDKEGLVCMANRGKGTNSSQFFLTLAPCEHLNAKHTIFGHVVSGQPVLHKLARLRVDKSDKPHDAVLIAHCGELEQRHSHKPPPAPPSQPQPTPASAKPNGSNDDRGRHRAQRSPSSPTTRHHRSAKHPPPPHSPSPPPHRQPRRRSDVLVDETRRGRSLTRSQSPPSPPHARPPSPRPRRRKRSPSRSSARARSRSPHLRRRHTRSRSRSRSRLRRMRGREWQREREEEGLRREEWEREGRGRWEGVLEEDGPRERERENGGRGGGGYVLGRDGRGGRWGDGGVGGAGAGAGAGNGDEVRFKGRGSMKYRERRW